MQWYLSEKRTNSYKPVAIKILYKCQVHVYKSVHFVGEGNGDKCWERWNFSGV